MGLREEIASSITTSSQNLFRRRNALARLHQRRFVLLADDVLTQLVDDYVIGQDHAKKVLSVAVPQSLQAVQAPEARTTTSSWRSRTYC